MLMLLITTVKTGSRAMTRLHTRVVRSLGVIMEYAVHVHVCAADVSGVETE